LNIASVFSTNAAFTVSATGSSVGAGDSVKVKVTFSPTLQGTQNGSIVTFHDGPSLQDTVSVSGTGVQAICAVNRKEINFDSIHGSTTKIDSFVVTNNGNVGLTVKVGSTSQFFSVLPESASIGVSASVTFRVTFRPDTAVGTKSGWLVLIHNGPTSPDSIYIFGDVTTDVNDWKDNLPTEFGLSQNYPNPFNPTTEIRFSVGTYGHTSLRVFDLLGREVAKLMNEEKPAGSYRMTWNASGIPSGVYFYRLEAGGLVETRKLVLVR
jgi:hypothetical protein